MAMMIVVSLMMVMGVLIGVVVTAMMTRPWAKAPPRLWNISKSL